MRLTTARYYTPSGRSIQALGIEPDITVQQAKVEEIKIKGGLHEADLKGALVNDTLKVDPSKKDKKLPEKTKPDAAAGKDETNATPDTDKPDDNADPQEDADGNTIDAKGKDAKKPFDYQLSRALDLLRGIALYDKRGLADKSAMTPAVVPATATPPEDK
jgi:carboxyl-terminal processing protease